MQDDYWSSLTPKQQRAEMEERSLAGQRRRDASVKKAAATWPGSSSAGDERPAQGLDWLTAPRKEFPQEYLDAFSAWCEVDAIDRQMQEMETTQPVCVTEILARRAALKELHAERARLLTALDGGSE